MSPPTNNWMYTKQYKENKKLSNTNHAKNWG